MPFLSGLFEHRGSEMLAREQASFFIRDAQKGTMEMGKLLKEITAAGCPDIAQQCSRLLQLNAQLGNTLEQLQRSLQ